MGKVRKFVRNFIFKRAQNAFKDKFGEELPIALEKLDALTAMFERESAITVAVFNMVGREYIENHGKDAYNEILKTSVREAKYKTEMIQEFIGDLAQTILIVQGVKLAEIEALENEKVND